MGIIGSVLFIIGACIVWGAGGGLCAFGLVLIIADYEHDLSKMTTRIENLAEAIRRMG